MGIEEEFRAANLTDTESSILLLLIQHENLSAAEIANSSDIKRTTVYAALANLESLHLVNKVIRNNVSRFQAAPVELIPDILENLAREKLNKVIDAAAKLKTELAQVAKSKKTDLSGFEIASVGSEVAVWSQVLEMLLKGDFKAMFNPQVTLADSKARKKTAEVLKKSSKTKPPIRELAVDGKITDWYINSISNPNHQVKTLPKDLEITTDIFISDGQVVIFSYDQGNERGISIKHSGLYTSMNALFNYLWKE